MIDENVPSSSFAGFCELDRQVPILFLRGADTGLCSSRDGALLS
jgi:hypothetical protein